MFAQETLRRRAQDIIDKASATGRTVATAESCTGGLVAGMLTAIPGSSAVLDRGFVTYSNAAKVEMLGVDPALLSTHGAVSAETAGAMAEGALAHSHADFAVAVTGIAGPGGGSDEKPIGLVHFALARRGGAVTRIERSFGDLGRDAVRIAAVAEALVLLERAVDGH